MARSGKEEDEGVRKAVRRALKPGGKHGAEFEAALELMREMGDADGAGRFLDERQDRWRRMAIASGVDLLDLKFEVSPDSLLGRIRAAAAAVGGASLNLPDFDSIERSRRRVLREIVEEALLGEVAPRTPGTGTLSAAGLMPSILHMASSSESSEAGTPHEEQDTEERNLKDRMFARLGAIYPDIALPSEAFRQWMDHRLASGRGPDFLALLKREQKRADERNNATEVDDMLLTMARHWLNPDHPLALMNASTGTTVLMKVFGFDVVSTDQFKERRKRFTSDKNYPIKGGTLFKPQGGSNPRPPQYHLRAAIEAAIDQIGTFA
ncbi:MAG TPA: hypothetical protein PLA50_01160 [Bacteroidia bacterium]|nr:hypothetical protein [Bacteroidia bacterium]